MSTRRLLRAAQRGAGLVAWTTLCVLPMRLGAPWAARDAARSWRWRCLWFRRWAKGALYVLGVRLQVVGAPPRPPFLLVCNHLGYLDIAVIASVVDTTFVAKSDVARWPILGPLCRWMGTLFVDRGRRRDLPATLAALQAQLAAGHGVVLFPEGTSTPGSRVLPFHPPLLAAAARAGMPVAWAALTYSTPAGERDAADAVCWWGDVSFVAHLWALLRLPRVEARLRLGDEPLAGTDRKQLAERLHAAVAAELELAPAGRAASSG